MKITILFTIALFGISSGLFHFSALAAPTQKPTELPALRLATLLSEAKSIQMPPLGLKYGATDLSTEIKTSEPVNRMNSDVSFQIFANSEIDHLVKKWASDGEIKIKSLQDLISSGTSVMIRAGYPETASIKKYLLSLVDPNKRAEVDMLLKNPEVFLQMTLIQVYDTGSEIIADELILIQGLSDRHIAIRIKYMQS